MGTVNLGQVAALIQSVTFETLPEGATPTVRNDGTKANAELVFGLPDVMTTAKVKEAVETKVKEAVAAKEVSLLTKIDKKFIEQYKNGYIQWPGMPSPLEDTSLHFEGYSWYEVNYDGNFFRAKGRNAKAFSSKRLTKEQIKNGAYIFQDDEQGDAIREIWGHSKTDINFTTGELRQNEMGAFFRSYAFNLPYKGSSGYLTYGDLVFRASRVVPTAEENRSRNLTFTIWVLVKD
ncbi:hypothetical protein [Treponema sp.]|uniref:hypothetical protein n=1 Tax=Treponema sp. TaxID=166 RepID=UPI003FA2C45D